MTEAKQESVDAAKPLSDEQLESVVGGSATDPDAESLNHLKKLTNPQMLNYLKSTIPR